MRIARLVCVFFVCCYAAVAADQGQALLLEITRAYLNLSSFHAKAEVTTTYEAGSFSQKNPSRAEVFWDGPRKLRVDRISSVGAASSLIDHNPTVGISLPIFVASRPMFYDRLLRPTMFLAGSAGMGRYLAQMKSVRLLPDEAVGERKCNVVEIEYGVDASVREGRPPQRIVLRLWTDPKTHFVWQESRSLEKSAPNASTPAQPVERSLIRIQLIEPNAKFPESTFDAEAVQRSLAKGALR